MIESVRAFFRGMTPYDLQAWRYLIADYANTYRVIHLLLWVALVGALVLRIRRHRYGHTAFAGVLGLLWAWVGLVFMRQYYTQLNWAAGALAWFWVIQALALGAWGLLSAPSNANAPLPRGLMLVALGAAMALSIDPHHFQLSSIYAITPTLVIGLSLVYLGVAVKRGDEYIGIIAVLMALLHAIFALSIEHWQWLLLVVALGYFLLRIVRQRFTH